MMKTAMRFWAAALLVLGTPALGLAQTIIPPSGDTTGKTDGAAINSALSTNLSAQLACNAHYYTNVTIDVVKDGSFTGCGVSTLITGVGTITGAIVQVSPVAAGGTGTYQLVGNFQITGGTATNAVNAGSTTQGHGPFLGVHLFNIWVSGGAYTDTFWFNTFFNNQVDNLQAVETDTVSHSCFHFDGQVNANTFNTLVADCGAPYGFYMENDNEPSESTGNTFNGLTAEGGCPGAGTSATCAGLYVGTGFEAATFNGLYTENVLHPIVLGNASAGKICTTLTFNTPVLTGPAAVGANQVALVDIDDCSSVTFISPRFNLGSIGSAAPLTFSGGGCSTEPTGVAMPNPSGIIKGVTLTYPGAGCTSAPAVAVGGAGSSASITATEAGGVVTGLTISAAGTGYTIPAGSILPVVYNTAYNAASIINPYCFSAQPCWAWMVHADGGGGYGVQFEGDALNIPNVASIPANLKYTGYGNQYYLNYLDSSGTTHLLRVAPQAYP